MLYALPLFDTRFCHADDNVAADFRLFDFFIYLLHYFLSFLFFAAIS